MNNNNYFVDGLIDAACAVASASTPVGQTTSNPLIYDAPVIVKNKTELSVCRRLLFGLAAPPLQISTNAVSFFFNIFLLEVVKIQPVHCSIILFGGRAWDALTDPIVGFFVSQTRTRFGRCRPWLLLSTPIGIISYFFLWYLPEMDSVVAKFVYFLLLYLLFNTLITCYHVPYTSMTMLISENPADRDSATSFRMGFEIAGTLLGTAIFGGIINNARLASQCGESEPGATASPIAIENEKNAYQIGAGVICALYFVCGMVGFFGCREVHSVVVERRESFLMNMKAVLKFKPYLLLLLAFMFLSLGIQIVQGNLAFYTTHSLQLSTHLSYGVMTVLAVAILAVPFWSFMMNKFGKKSIFAAGTSILIPVLFVAMYAPPNLVILYYATMAVSGLGISVAMLLPWSMLPDVIDDYMLKHGQRKEATFYSLYVFFNKFAVGISMAFSQLALELGGYDVSKCTQAGSVGLAVRYLMGPIPIICLLVALVFLWLYPINESTRQANKLQILEMQRQHRIREAERATASQVTVCDSNFFNVDNHDMTASSQQYIKSLPNANDQRTDVQVDGAGDIHLNHVKATPASSDV